MITQRPQEQEELERQKYELELTIKQLEEDIESTKEKIAEQQFILTDSERALFYAKERMKELLK